MPSHSNRHPHPADFRMSAKNSEPHSSSVALEIKSGSITLPILRLFTSDLEAVSFQLEEKLRRAPDFFRNTPVVIDLSELDPDREPIDFPALMRALRGLELVPAGVRGGGRAQHQAAQAAKLAILAEAKHESGPTPVAAPSAQNAPSRLQPPAKPAGSSKLIEQPVRSGQRIYAQGGDLIVRAQVSPGAEIIADGNIHIYGSLRGRALAGVQGNLEARIFCADLQAELVGIGGHYKISENIDGAVRGKPVHIYLQNDTLIIDPL
jgi:septum site-determining protein MinC